MPSEPSRSSGVATIRDLSTSAPTRSARRAGAHGLRRGEVPAAREHGHLAQHRPLPLVEQFPGPVDDRAQGLLAGQDRTAAGGEEAEAVVEAVGDLARGEQPQPGRRQFDGERQSVEAAADLRDGLPVGERGGRVGADGGRALREEAVRLVGEEGLDRAHRLAGDAQGFTAGGEDREPGAAGEEGLGEVGRRVDDMFAVVKDQELAARGAVLDEQGERVVLRGRQLGGHQHGLAQTERADHRAGHRLRPVERGELDQPRLREPGGGFLGEAGLSGAARSGEGDESGPVHIRNGWRRVRVPGRRKR